MWYAEAGVFFVEELLREWWGAIVPILGLVAWWWRKSRHPPRNKTRSLTVEKAGERFKLVYQTAWGDQSHRFLPNPERSSDEDGEREDDGEGTESGDDDG